LRLKVRQLQSVAVVCTTEEPSGFIVLGIDYFLGDAINKHTGEANWDRNAWIQKSRPLSELVTPKWLEAVRKEYGQSFVNMRKLLIEVHIRDGRQILCCRYAGSESRAESIMLMVNRLLFRWPI
jgi:hypothetical protein